MIRIADLKPESLVDGKGVRFVIFTQGCPHHCKGCFNPQTHDPHGGSDFYHEDIIDEIVNNKIISGVTFSGGEPFDQPHVCQNLAWNIKRKTNLNIWAYTGYTWEELMNKVDNECRLEIEAFLNNIDVLVDGKFEEDKKDDSLVYCGSTNQRIIDVQRSLKEGKIVLWS